MTYEYTTISLVEAEIRASTPFSVSTLPSLTQVTTWIAEESEEINQIGGRIYGSTSYSETIDYAGEEVIQLKNAPIISVESVLYSANEYGSSSYALSDTKTVDTDYGVYLDSGEIVVLPSWAPAEGRKRIQINYTAGYSTVPFTVQKLATKKVAKRVIDSLIENNVQEGNVGGSISVGSISIVEPENLSLGTYKQLMSDIDALENKLVSGFNVYRYPLRY